MKRTGLFVLLLLGLAAGLSWGCKPSGDGKPTVGYVTNCVDPFWDLAAKGARDAAAEHNVTVEIVMPDGTPADQKRRVEELLVRGVAGIAISPTDPQNQGDLLEAISAKCSLITQDSDAPKSPRLCFIGVDNYIAGRECGQLVKKALPDGGSVILFVGVLGQENADLRRQGLIDELLDRSMDRTRRDANSGPIRGDKYTILDTRTDNFDKPKAKSQAEQALVNHADLGCMVGLFAYNPPLILEAIRAANKVGKVKVVAFDEHPDTLAAIAKGEVTGTVVQNPYKYGYESVRVLAALARGDRTVLPAEKVIDVPARAITRDNVESFQAELKKQLAK